jgi:phosphoglycerate dehydrogenase-like enzyme
LYDYLTVLIQERGISVCNTPGINATAVAELVIAHIFAIACQLGDITVRQRNGEKFQRHDCSGLQISGKAVGIIGMGAIGKSVAGMLHHGFACKIYAYDPFGPKDAWPEFPYVRVENVKDMLPVVNILTLHVPLLETTKNLIGITELRAMKENYILINHSRGMKFLLEIIRAFANAGTGGIVNEDELVAALKEGQIWGPGIDALVYDPPTLDKY